MGRNVEDLCAPQQRHHHLHQGGRRPCRSGPECPPSRGHPELPNQHAKDNIERAIKKATDKDAADLKQVTFEGYGPHGIAVFVETATDNNNRTVANVRSYFNKCNGNLGTSGSVEFMFTHVCHFKIAAEGQDAEELELELIDYGAEDIGVDEDAIMIYGPFESFGSLQKKLEGDGIEILESGFDRIPTDTKELDLEATAEVEKLIEKLEEDDDVQNVFHTMSSSTED